MDDLIFTFIFICIITILLFIFSKNKKETFLIASCYHYPNDLTGVNGLNHLERGSDPMIKPLDQSVQRSDCSHPKQDTLPFTYNTGNCCNIPGESAILSEILCEMINEKENSYYSKNLNDPGTISESLPDKSIQSFDNVTKEEDEITNEDNYPTKKQDSSQENFIENVINDS